MVAALEERQELFKKTGGCLASRARRDFAGAVAVLSGRGGFELVLKALRVGIPVIVSVSAASSLAIEIAEEAGATLVGFVRGGARAPRVYADDGRLQAP
jgi:FdhD protein